MWCLFASEGIKGLINFPLVRKCALIHQPGVPSVSAAPDGSHGLPHYHLPLPPTHHTSISPPPFGSPFDPGLLSFLHPPLCRALCPTGIRGVQQTTSATARRGKRMRRSSWPTMWGCFQKKTISSCSVRTMGGGGVCEPLDFRFLFNRAVF